MNEYDVTFSEGMSALGGARRCRICRLSPDSTVVLLKSLESDQPPLLLGCVCRICPELSLAVTDEERKSLGLEKEEHGEDIRVFCRLVIPDGDPLSAGFALSRLVLAVPDKGTAMETLRPSLPFVPLKVKKDTGNPENGKD